MSVFLYFIDKFTILNTIGSLRIMFLYFTLQEFVIYIHFSGVNVLIITERRDQWQKEFTGINELTVRKEFKEKEIQSF